jgi:hypothetical protein
LNFYFKSDFDGVLSLDSMWNCLSACSKQIWSSSDGAKKLYLTQIYSNFWELTPFWFPYILEMRRPLQNLLVYLLNFYFKSDFDGVLSLDSMWNCLSACSKQIWSSSDGLTDRMG